MEPNMAKLVWKRRFGNAHDLSDLLLKAAEHTHVSMYEINVSICGDGDNCNELQTGVAVLEAESLSDASIVYNITLH